MISARKLWILFLVTVLLVGTILPAAVPVRADTDPLAPTVLAIKNTIANGIGWNELEVTVILIATANQSGTGIKEIHYTIDKEKGGTENVEYSSIAQFQLTDDGQHTITYYAVDTAGKQSDPVPWVPKTVAITSPTNGYYYPPINPADFPHWIYTVTDYSTGVPITVPTDQGQYSAGCTPGVNFVDLQNAITDRWGNISTASAWYVVVDMVPEILIDVPADKGIYKLGTLAEKPIFSVLYYDESYTVLPIEGYSTELGTHTVTITATDPLGNSGSDTATYIVSKNPRKEIDKTSPVITIKSPVAKTYYSYEDLRIHIGVQSKHSGFATYEATLTRKDVYLPVTVTVKNLQKIDLSTLAVGQYAFTVIAKDNAYVTANDGAYLVATKTVIFNVVAGVRKANIKVTPQTINLKSTSDKNAVTAIVNIYNRPKGSQIDVSTVKMAINGNVISALPPSQPDKYSNSVIKFDRQQVINALTGINKFPSKVTVTVSGYLTTDRTSFNGSDTITVINQEIKDDGHQYDKPGNKDDDHDSGSSANKDNNKQSNEQSNKDNAKQSNGQSSKK